MAINDAVQLGWEYSAKHAGGAIGAFESSEYIAEVTDAIQKLDTLIKREYIESLCEKAYDEWTKGDKAL